MANVIKGLTVEIGGDTTKLGKALEDVNKQSRSLSSELGQVNKLLRMDPGNTDLLAQKQQILADAITNTSKKLDTLKEAERQVQQQFERGEVSAEQVRALQREIVEATNKLGQYENAAKETAQALEQVGDSAQEAAQDSAELGGALDTAVTTGFKAVTGAAAAAIGALVASAETTREYRTEMGKLDTAFTNNGHTSEAALGAYKELQGVLGETDQAVEAANHLAVLTDNEKDLATWTGDILPGVFSTFGASLPIEGLTEAANETAKVGQVTGPLADALNWAGISEEKFNESLAKCTTEQERQQLIMQTLADTYGTASEAYKETNADVIAANQANEAWMASLAQVGAAAEPVITQVKTIGAELLGKLVPVIESLLANLPTIGVLMAGTAASFVAFKVAAIAATAATQGMTLAQYAAAAAQKALNVVMNANPIGLVILAITGLVAAFTYLWQNSESFREFWINLWEKIKSAVDSALAFFKTAPAKIYDALKGAIERVQTWGNQVASKAKTAATNTLNNVINILKNLPSKVASAIAAAIDRVQTWGSNMVSAAKSAMTNLVSNVVGIVSELPGKFLSVGKDIIRGLIDGIDSMISTLYNKIKNALSGLVSKAMDALGINSPSRVFRDKVGKHIPTGIAAGIEENMDAPIDAMQDINSGMLGAAGSFDGMSLQRSLSRPSVPSVAAAAAGSGLSAKLDKILTLLERGQTLTIDGDKLVGATAERFDAKLGQRRALAARGAL